MFAYLQHDTSSPLLAGGVTTDLPWVVKVSLYLHTLAAKNQNRNALFSMDMILFNICSAIILGT